MRIWQEYLMNYAPATDDFLAWLNDAKTSIIAKIEEASEEDDSKKMVPLARELKVYKRIESTFRAEFRERQSQLERGAK